MVAERASAAPATAKTTVQVTIISADLVGALIRSTAGLDRPRGPELRMLVPLRLAQQACTPDRPRVGTTLLKTLIGEVEAQRGNTGTDQEVDPLIGHTKLILDCV